MGEEHKERYDPRLNEWENRVLRRMHDLYSPSEVAKEFHVTRDSVYNTCRYARIKVGVNTTAELMRATKDTLGYA